MILKGKSLNELFGVRDRTTAVLAAVAAAALFLNWGLITAFLVPRLGTLRFLRLHYSAALGIDWVDAWWNIYVFPGLGAAAFFINGFFSGILSKKSRLVGVVVLFTTVLIELFLAGGGVIAVLLNS